MICASVNLHCISCIKSKKISATLGISQTQKEVLRKIKMSERHFRCLCLLFENKGIIKNKEEIITHVWQGCIVGPTSLGVLISELRVLLAILDVSIVTARGKGYVLLDKDEVEM